MHRFFQKADAFQYRQEVQQIADKLKENPPPRAIPPPPPRPVGRPPKKRDASVLLAAAAEADPEKTQNKRVRGPYVRWFNSPYINDILAAHRRTGFAARRTVTLLRQEAPDDRYKHLSHSTVASWFDKNNRLIPQHQMELEQGAAAVNGTGPCSPLLEAEGASRSIAEVLLQMRQAGTPLNTHIIRWVMHAILQSKYPSVLEKLELSKSFISRWVQSYEDLKFSWRARTTAASHLPDDWETQGIDMAMRIAAAMRLHSVSRSHPFTAQPISEVQFRIHSSFAVFFAGPSLPRHQHGSNWSSSGSFFVFHVRAHRQRECCYRGGK